LKARYILLLNAFPQQLWNISEFFTGHQQSADYSGESCLRFALLDTWRWTSVIRHKASLCIWGVCPMLRYVKNC